LYEKAALQGDVLAQTNLGQAYETGQGVKQEYCVAIHWYEKAAVQRGAQQ
jgi:TPR repeat protein